MMEVRKAVEWFVISADYQGRRVPSMSSEKLPFGKLS